MIAVAVCGHHLPWRGNAPRAGQAPREREPSPWSNASSGASRRSGFTARAATRSFAPRCVTRRRVASAEGPC